jgi:putative effector of murein hydrolase LrgA (UPF0299 family)
VTKPANADCTQMGKGCQHAVWEAALRECRRRVVPNASASSPAFVPESVSERMQRYAQVAVTAAVLLAFNEGVKVMFQRFGISVPHTLGGMLIVITVSLVGKAAGTQTGVLVDSVVDLFAPLRDWIARWMPVFFVPSLVALPQATAGIPGSQAIKVAQVTAGGWFLSLLLAAFLVQTIRGAAHCEITSDEVCDD